MSLSQDFRVRSDEDMEAFVDAKHNAARVAAVLRATRSDIEDADADMIKLSRGKLWVRGGLPKDRPGLIAAMHVTTFINEEIPAAIAVAAKREVWVITTDTEWVLWGFTIDGEVPYEPSDQYCGTWDSNGKYKLVGAS